MKKILLLICILVFAVTLAHELTLDAVPMQQTAFSELPVLTEEEYRRTMLRLPWMADSLSLSAAGQSLPTDENGLYYAPVSEGITVELPARAKAARTAFETDEHGNTTCKIIRYDGVSRSVCRLLITGLPVLDLQLIDRDSENIPIGDTGRELGLVRLFHADAQGSVAVQMEAATARVRGGSSRNYDKKSYTIAFVDELGAPRTAQLLDLPPDTEYGLNSLYEDDTKIRDIFSLRLWEQLDEETRREGEQKNAIAMDYTELLIDGQYWGLYGLQQLITPQALALEAGDALYKIGGAFKSSNSKFLRAQAVEIVQDTPNNDGESKFQKAWTAFRDYAAAESATLDADNALNYALLLQIACCVDNDTRNMALTYRAASDAFYMIGWDLDQTFGACWTGIAPTFIGNDLSIAEVDFLAMHRWKVKPFSSLLDSNPALCPALEARYRTLRNTILSDEALLQEANALFDLVTDTGARARDAKRWPKSAISTDNSFIETFIVSRMAYLDSLYLTVDAPDC